MKDYIEERALEIAKYIISEKATVRQAAVFLALAKAQSIKMLQNAFLR